MEGLTTRDLTLGYEKTVVIEDLDLRVEREKVTVLVGANGSGKSTLLRSLARLLKPKSGQIILDGQDIAHRPTREVAKRLSVLPQSAVAPEGITVIDLVNQGRYPHQRFLRQWSEEDERAVQTAMERTGIAELAERPVDTLSGGQRQRAWIAMTLAQDTPIMLLDEPITYLDMNHQIELLDLLDRLNHEEGRTIVMVLHDLNLEARYAQELVVVHGGSVYAQGPPDEVVKPDLIEKVFGIRAEISRCPVFGTPLCVAYGNLASRRKEGAEKR